MNRLEIKPVDDDASLAEVRALIREHLEAHSTQHDAAGIQAILDRLPAPYLPGGGLWIGWADGKPAGSVAIYHANSHTAELKRMYVRPAHRGQGIARALAEHAISEARARGYERMRLGTLTTMEPAQALYGSLGFTRIAPYRSIEFGDTLFYELVFEGKGQSSREDSSG